MIRSLPLAVLTHPVNAWARENFTRKLGHLLLGPRAPSPAVLANHTFERKRVPSTKWSLKLKLTHHHQSQLLGRFRDIGV